MVKNKYIFPNILANWMSKVDMRTQYEASMLSMFLMLLGLIVTITYFVFFFGFALWYKFVLVLNGIAGFVFMSSFLITTYQQYLSYMETIDFQNNMKGGNIKNGKKERNS